MTVTPERTAAPADLPVPTPAAGSPAAGSPAGSSTPTVFGPVAVQLPVPSPLADGELAVAHLRTGASVTVVVRGELLQETASRFTDALAGLVDDATVDAFVVDLSGTSFMDSTGLGTLVSLRNRLLQRGAAIMLVRPDDRVFRLFELTHLDTLFDFVLAA